MNGAKGSPHAYTTLPPPPVGAVGATGPGGYMPIINFYDEVNSKLRSQLASALEEIEAYRKVQRALHETIRVMASAPPVPVAPSKVENPNEALQGKADEVIKGILGGKLPAKKVDEIGEAVGKARADRSVGRAIGAARLTVGLITQI